MHGSPNAEQHGDDACTQDVKSAAGIRTRFPVHDIGAVAEEKRTHLEAYIKYVRGTNKIIQLGSAGGSLEMGYLSRHEVKMEVLLPNTAPLSALS